MAVYTDRKKAQRHDQYLCFRPIRAHLQYTVRIVTYSPGGLFFVSEKDYQLYINTTTAAIADVDFLPGI